MWPTVKPLDALFLYSVMYKLPLLLAAAAFPKPMWCSGGIPVMKYITARPEINATMVEISMVMALCHKN